ncbi:MULTISPECIES: molybdopterin-dependent oxidoreductase [unclassified Streptomyces]|uniref:molybdopterin-dependent oxidoreductase n=1 Tax=unclassified Streptomyces TaxID=2593676 RepID=UPI000B8A10A2|nr:MULTISPECIES: molybdopterin-dependent oxidoreductase [unclassified Streptomyces]
MSAPPSRPSPAAPSSPSSPPSSSSSSSSSPASPSVWRSPLRGPRLTALLGVVLLAGITLLFVTGLLSYAAYNPELAGGVNDKTPGKGLLGFYLFSWPTGPSWLYRLTQGLHVTVGIALVPVLLAKLWSVIPKLFTLPPARSLGHALERLSLLLLVGGALFEFVTGILNIQLEYVFPGSFYPLHFYGAWVFMGAFAGHVVLRAPRTVRALRERTDPGPAADDTGLVAARPDRPTVTRRGALGLVGAGSLLLFTTTAGQNAGGWWRRTALLAPHGGRDPDSGPNGFQINKTAAGVGITDQETGDDWRLTIEGGGRRVRLGRAELLALPQHTAALPIACVEGWSTGDQQWSGVRLRDLAALVGLGERPPGVLVESLQLHGAFRRAALRDNQVRDPSSLLALRVGGAELSADHGYPARIIVPAAPGVLQTKWVARLTFGEW